MTSENPIGIYEVRIAKLLAAGLLSDTREPVGISLFEELPPLSSIHTRRIPVLDIDKGMGKMLPMQLHQKRRAQG